ncbi:protein of unknown function [Actinopolyspora xinjiangensis]|uniref:DUF397 domain-containing protein n=1 Tax=Actinopolyspora xinjiangensis TaxID=405564 RepID=A0A1H0TQ88_9ACTN|nr:DUF397 domain-containing protein [Actinopolyspora xinjiangensis]SDP56174.1 protein of unknown function [Actinopolyspora xinjiangensis]
MRYGCVRNAAELTVRWSRSSHSGPNGGQCVETATLPGGEIAAVRDSKRPHGPALLFDRRAWTAFLRSLRRIRRPRPNDPLVCP